MKKTTMSARYPALSILSYNGAPALHYQLGGIGIISGCEFLWTGYLGSYLYLAFPFIQMYVIIPLYILALMLFRVFIIFPKVAAYTVVLRINLSLLKSWG